MGLIDTLTLTFSVVAVFLLVLGLPLVKGINTMKNLQRHGILTGVALALEAVLIFLVMIPSVIDNFNEIVTLAIGFSINMWVHIVLGSAAFISGLAYLALWLVYYKSGMKCFKAKKYMMPTMIVWVIALVSGALIVFLQML